MTIQLSWFDNNVRRLLSFSTNERNFVGWMFLVKLSSHCHWGVTTVWSAENCSIHCVSKDLSGRSYYLNDSLSFGQTQPNRSCQCCYGILKRNVKLLYPACVLECHSCQVRIDSSHLKVVPFFKRWPSYRSSISANQ